MEYESEWSKRLVACSKGNDSMGVGETDNLISYIENLVTKERELETYRSNVKGVLDGLGTLAQRVREGGGDEDLLMSLAATAVRLEILIKGPDGYDTWQEAATAERVRRAEAEKKLEAAEVVNGLVSKRLATIVEAVNELEDERDDGDFPFVAEKTLKSSLLAIREYKTLKKEKEAGRYPWNALPGNAFDMLKKGGQWVGRVHDFIQRKAINGERVTWGSHEWLTMPSVSVADMEYLAADIALAAVKDFQQDRERERRFSDTIDGIKTGKIPV